MPPIDWADALAKDDPKGGSTQTCVRPGERPVQVRTAPVPEVSLSMEQYPAQADAQSRRTD